MQKEKRIDRCAGLHHLHLTECGGCDLQDQVGLKNLFRTLHDLRTRFGIISVGVIDGKTCSRLEQHPETQ